MIKIEIDNTDVDIFSGNSKRDGKPFSIRKQRAWAHLSGDKYPSGIEIVLEEGQAPYQPGAYMLAPESVFVGRFGRLEIGRIKLNPLSKSHAA